jgi:hypothetical protein
LVVVVSLVCFIFVGASGVALSRSILVAIRGDDGIPDAGQRRLKPGALDRLVLSC